MVQNWAGYIWPACGLLGFLAIALYMKCQGNRSNKALRVIRDSQIELMARVSQVPAAAGPDFTQARAFAEPPEDTQISRAEAELLSKIQAAVQSEN